MAAPDRLYFTNDDEANRLIASDPFALLVGFALDQQVTVPTAFAGPLKLLQRLGTLDPKAIAATDPARVEAAFREKPAIHRFPGAMAARVHELAATVAEDYGGHAERIWTDARDGDDLRARLAALPGLRRDEDQEPRRGAREALRRRRRRAARAEPPDARRRRLRRRRSSSTRPRSARTRRRNARRRPDRPPDAQRRRPAGGAHGRTRWRTSSQPRSSTLEIAIYDFHLPDDLEADRRERARRRVGARRRGAARVQRRPREEGQRAAAAPHEAGARRGAAVPDRRHPRRPRPDAPQVRDPRPVVGVDRLDELDARLVDARGERDRHRRLEGSGGALLGRLRAALDEAERAAQRQGRDRAGLRGGPADPRLVLSRPRRQARAPDREGDRLGRSAGSGSRRR